MSFLHGEFLFWLLIPTLILFYFWLTQKPLHHRWLDEAMLERLRAPENTMNLKGRNTLFLTASMLLIIAMAQPVMMNSTPIRGGMLHIVIAIQTGGSAEALENNRAWALQTLYTVLGEEIELIAYDQNLYCVAPRSNDGGILAELIRHLKPSAASSSIERVSRKLTERSDADMKIIVSSGIVAEEGILSVANENDVEKVHETLNALRDAHRLQAHIPLFYYPLALAMVLILLALSSMSKRQSVRVGSVALIVALHPPTSEAGIFDFKLLQEARSAYEEGKYHQSERLYARYQMEHDSAEVRYNRANALYMSGEFEKAAYWYKRVHTSDLKLSEQTRYNLKKTESRLKTAVLKEQREKNDNIAQKRTSPLSLSEKGKKEKNTRLFVY